MEWGKEYRLGLIWQDYQHKELIDQLDTGKNDKYQLHSSLAAPGQGYFDGHLLASLKVFAILVNANDDTARVVNRVSFVPEVSVDYTGRYYLVQQRMTGFITGAYDFQAVVKGQEASSPD